MTARAKTPALSQAAPDPTDPIDIVKPMDPVETAKSIDLVDAAKSVDFVDITESTQDPVTAPGSSGLTVQQIPPPAVPARLLALIGVPSAQVERDIFEIVAEARAALARGVETMSDELASFARLSIDTTADAAIGMLAIRTWSDAVAVNARFARISYDQWIDSAAKVSELGVKLAYESSKPFVARFEKMWSGGHLAR